MYNATTTDESTVKSGAGGSEDGSPAASRLRRVARVWTPSGVKIAIRAMARDGLPLTYESAERIHPGLCEAARRYYGSWHAALLMAGLEVN